MSRHLGHLHHHDRSIVSARRTRFIRLSPGILPPVCQNQTTRSRSGPSTIIQKYRSVPYQTLYTACSPKLVDKSRDATATLSKYEVQEHPLGKHCPLRVIIIGAGINGLNMLYTLKKETKYVEFILYDKNSECGGTWYENRYPGCASDDPSHHYQYTHSLNPSWSSIFAQAGEIKQYLNEFIDNNEMRKSIKCGHSISSAVWNESNSQWKVTVKEEATGRRFDTYSQIVIDASGIFNNYKWPQVKGLCSFRGSLIHTANWPSNFDLHNKTVAVLGNGASGVQIIPAIQPEVKKLIHCIRSKTWIAPPGKAANYCSQYTIGSSGLFTSEWMKTLAENPKEYEKFLSEIDKMARGERFKTILSGSNEAQLSNEIITEYMTKQLNNNQELMETLIPTMPVGCRRITSSPNYLPALCQANVELAKSQIKEVTTTGILLESGEFHEVEAIICATGFNTSFLPRFPIIGEHGLNLQDAWAEENGGPKAYKSLMAEGMPNYFRKTNIRTHSNLPHKYPWTQWATRSRAIPRLSSQLCNYILAHVQKMQLEDYSSIRPLPAAVHDFNEHIQAFMPRTAWAAMGCGGWYRTKTPRADARSDIVGGEEKVTALHPGSQSHWEQMLADVRWEDFEYRRGGGRQANRFSYLGNGFAASELVAEKMEK